MTFGVVNPYGGMGEYYDPFLGSTQAAAAAAAAQAAANAARQGASPAQQAQAAAAAAAAAAASNMPGGSFDPFGGVEGGVEGYPGYVPGGFDQYVSSLSFFNPGDSQSPLNSAGKTLEQLIEAAKRAAQAGGANAIEALKFLAEQGDWFAKVALAFGIGYAAATALLVAGAGIVVVVILKK